MHRLLIIGCLLGLLCGCVLACSDTTTKPPTNEAPTNPFEGQKVTTSSDIPGLKGQVYVLNVEANVPHIYAKNKDDLYFMAGYITAKDRYIQFELGRRLGQGKASELLGSLLLDIDVENRTRGLAYVAQRLVDNLSPELQSIFQSYANGINAYIDQVQAGTLPVPEELKLVGELFGVTKPASYMQKVGVKDICGMAAVIVSELGYESYDMTRSQMFDRIVPAFPKDTPFQNERLNGFLEDIFLNIKPLLEHSSAKDWNSKDGKANLPLLPTQRFVPKSSGLPQSMLQRFAKRERRFMTMLGKSHNLDFGSNGWVVAGSHTASGGGLLAGDGHLPLGIPPLFYQMCLDTKTLGKGDIKLCGLFFPGLPFLAVGTNSHIAWTQTYLRGDITDWYKEEIKLNSNGEPESSVFQGSSKPLKKTEESYKLGDPSTPGSFTKTVVHPRWQTFDGRWIVSMEGKSYSSESSVPKDKKAFRFGSEWIVPGDTNNDGKISAISYDWTAFDITKTLEAVLGFSRAKSVKEFQEQTKKLVAYAQNIVVTDKEGGVLYTGYNATPCRSYLGFKEKGQFQEGGHPSFLLDGTKYGGFTIPTLDNGLVDESKSNDPSRCVVPFTQYPQQLGSPAGYLITANNDVGGLGYDNNLANDASYVGGPYNLGMRAENITQGMVPLLKDKKADVASMAKLQGRYKSIVGELLVPPLLKTLEEAKKLLGSKPSWNDDQKAAMAIYEANQSKFEDVEKRLKAWKDRGYLAESGVKTFYSDPSEAQQQDSVATMIFHTWLRRLFAQIFSDEKLGDVWSLRESDRVVRALYLLLEGRGANNPKKLKSWVKQTEESAFFDIRGTDRVERSLEVILLALQTTLKDLAAKESKPGEGGFGTEDMTKWRWGLRHMVRFPSLLELFAGGNAAVAAIGGPFEITPKKVPLLEGLANDNPLQLLPGFPRQGDNSAVDAAPPGFSGPTYSYTNGPVMRMVIHLNKGKVEGVNVIPGGQSGDPSSTYFADQAKLWLGNKTVPIRYHVKDLLPGIKETHLYKPKL